MTVRIEHIVYTEDRDYLDLRDVPTLPVSPEDVLSLVRNIIRERATVKQARCTIIPEVNGVARLPELNKWGHDLLIDVTYDSRGHRAVYGAVFEDGKMRVTCYMD